MEKARNIYPILAIEKYRTLATKADRYQLDYFC